MSTLERIGTTPELAGFPLASRVVLAIALDDGRPLRPVTKALDREILLRAEHLVRRERIAPRDALERARGEAPRNGLERARGKEIDEATLRGILRFARALHETGAVDDVVARELDRRQLVDEAFWLFARTPAAPVEIDVEAVKAMFGATEGAVELDEPGDPLDEEWGPILGLCARCGDVVRGGDAMHPLTLAVFAPGRTKSAWRRASVTDVTPKREQPTRLAELLLAAEEPILCWACTVRLEHKLITPIPDSAEFVEPFSSVGRSPGQRAAGGALGTARDEPRAEDPDRRQAVLEHVRGTGLPLDVDDSWDEAILERAHDDERASRPERPVDEERAIAIALTQPFDAGRRAAIRTKIDFGAGARAELRARICAQAWAAGTPLRVLSEPVDQERMLEVERLVFNGLEIDRAIERVRR